MPITDNLHDFFQGAFWRAPFKSFSPHSVFGESRLRGLLVVARSLLTVAKNPAGLQKDTTAPAGATSNIIIGRLLGNHHIMRMTLFQPCSRNPNKLPVPS